jgi:5-methylcytosine-specific restriction endonuclease McrA
VPWSTSRRPGSTRRSRKERALILTMWPTCYLRYPGCTVHSTEDDHVIPLSQGGTDALSNRRGACVHCHGIKTRQEAAQAKTTKHNNRRRNPEPHPGTR